MYPDAVVAITQNIPVGAFRLLAAFHIGCAGIYGIATRLFGIPQILPVSPGVRFVKAN